jgi:hypothetical protein
VNPIRYRRKVLGKGNYIFLKLDAWGGRFHLSLEGLKRDRRHFLYVFSFEIFLFLVMRNLVLTLDPDFAIDLDLASESDLVQ